MVLRASSKGASPAYCVKAAITISDSPGANVSCPVTQKVIVYLTNLVVL